MYETLLVVFNNAVATLDAQQNTLHNQLEKHLFDRWSQRCKQYEIDKQNHANFTTAELATLKHEYDQAIQRLKQDCERAQQERQKNHAAILDQLQRELNFFRQTGTLDKMSMLGVHWDKFYCQKSFDYEERMYMLIGGPSVLSELLFALPFFWCLPKDLANLMSSYCCTNVTSPHRPVRGFLKFTIGHHVYGIRFTTEQHVGGFHFKCGFHYFHLESLNERVKFQPIVPDINQRFLCTHCHGPIHLKTDACFVKWKPVVFQDTNHEDALCQFVHYQCMTEIPRHLDQDPNRPISSMSWTIAGRWSPLVMLPTLGQQRALRKVQVRVTDNPGLHRWKTNGATNLYIANLGNF